MKVFWNSIICVAVLAFGSVFAYAATGINSGKPVPYLQNDAASAEFIAAILAKETSADQREIEKFSRKFVATLGFLSPDDQAEVWYGAEGVPDGGGIRPEVQNRIDNRTANGMPLEGVNFINNLIANDLPLTRDEWSGILAIPEQPSDFHLSRLEEADLAAGGSGGP